MVSPVCVSLQRERGGVRDGGNKTAGRSFVGWKEINIVYGLNGSSSFVYTYGSYDT